MCEHRTVRAAAEDSGAGQERSAFLSTPMVLRVWVGLAVSAALFLPFALASLGRERAAHHPVLTALLLVLLAALDVELGRSLEGRLIDSQ